MIVDNTTSEIGDELLIQVSLPIFGLTQINDFEDSVDGETENRYFEKYFCFSLDGVFYSDWFELNQQNLQSIQIQNTQPLFVNYKYIRSGSDSSGILTFYDISLNGNYSQPQQGNNKIIGNSIFKDVYYYNPTQAYWKSIFLKKLYEKGVVPEYIIRGEDEKPQISDKDYLSFWGSVSSFFALMIPIFYKLENINDEFEILCEFLLQKGLYFSKNNILIEELQFLKSNRISEIRQRGTQQVFLSKSESKQVYGEFLRIIEYAINDELLISLLNNENCGWFLGKNSPMYCGTNFNNQLIKGVEKTQNFESLNNYDTLNTQYLQIINEDNIDVLKISDCGDGNISGIGFDTNYFDYTQIHSTIVSDKIDYEITFWVKQTSNKLNLSFGVRGLDVDGNLKQIFNLSGDDEMYWFFEKIQLPIVDKWYFVRGVLCNYQSLTNNKKTNLGVGNNLKMSQNIAKIEPFIVMDNTDYSDSSACDIFVKDLKIRPLVKGLSLNQYKSSFLYLTTNNILNIICKNNNDAISEYTLNDITRSKLIPYNSCLNIKTL